jgi:Ni2+-binding GTPase involved in maturation of urease and hydrogenase
MNLEAKARLEAAHSELWLLFVESGGDNLAAAFSPELVDRWIYVMMWQAAIKFLAKAALVSCAPIYS